MKSFAEKELNDLEEKIVEQLPQGVENPSGVARTTRKKGEFLLESHLHRVERFYITLDGKFMDVCVHIHDGVLILSRGDASMTEINSGDADIARVPDFTLG